VDEPRGGGRAVLVLLMVFMAVNFADKAVLGLLADPIRDDLHLSGTRFGAMAGAFYLLFSLSSLGVGFLGDRLRARPLLAALVVVWSAAQLAVLAPAAGFGLLLATRVVLGAGEGPAFPLANHTVFTWYPVERRSLPSALISVGGAAGAILGGPLILAVTGALGWRAAFGVLGLAGVLWLPLWLRRGAEGPYSARERPEESPRVPYRRVLLTGTWLGGTFASFTVMWSLALGLTWIPTYLKDDAEFSDAAVSGVIGLPSVTGIVFVLVTGTLAQRLIRRGVSHRAAQGLLGAAVAAVAGVCMLGMTRVGPVVLMLPLLAVAFSAGSAQAPLTNAALARVCPPGQRGAALGASYAVAATASVLAPVVTGRIVDVSGFSAAFDLAAGLLLAGGAVAALTVRPERDAVAPSVAVAPEPAAA
jgi:MFS family permease